MRSFASLRSCLTNEHESALLYTAILIPFALTLTIAAVDLSGVSASQDSLQREADRIAITAARMLPLTEQVDIYLAHEAQHLRKKGIILNPTDFSPTILSDSVIQVLLRETYPSIFDIFLQRSMEYTINATALAEVVPTDLVLILPDGPALKPRRGEAAWGTSASWPPSGYFSQITPTVLSTSSTASIEGAETVLDFSDYRTQRWATQSCFNPYWSAIKQSAISIIDSVGSLSFNRVSVIFSPGSQPGMGFSTLRSIQGQIQRADGTKVSDSIGGFSQPTTQGAESNWNSVLYRDVAHLLGDEACALFSLYDTSGNYLLTPPAPHYGIKHAPRSYIDPVSITPVGARHNPYQRLAEDYLSNNLQLREAIYWHAAKSEPPSGTLSFDLIHSLEQAALEVSSTPSAENLVIEKQVRGNIALRALRTVLVFADSLPELTPELSNIFTTLATLNAKTIVVPLLLPSFDATQKAKLEQQAVALRATDPESLNLTVFEPVTIERLSGEIAPRLINFQKGVAIRQ